MEKWRDQIEEILSENRTVNRWIIRDLVRQEDDPNHQTTLAAMSHLMTAMKLLYAGPDAISEPEFKERIKKSFTEAGLPEEMVNGLFAWLDRQDILEPGNPTGEAVDEETNESLGDDE